MYWLILKQRKKKYSQLRRFRLVFNIFENIQVITTVSIVINYKIDSRDHK